MNTSTNQTAVIQNKLQWEDKYSVGVAEIDLQHQTIFDAINQLIVISRSIPTAAQLTEVINSLLEYKKIHFATEEKYFKQFNYENAASHIAAHALFDQRIEAIVGKYKDDVLASSYELIDFLEDWLIEHLQTEDQKYKECFTSNGLK